MRWKWESADFVEQWLVRHENIAESLDDDKVDSSVDKTWIKQSLFDEKVSQDMRLMQRLTTNNSSLLGHGCKKVPRQICKPSPAPVCNKVPHQGKGSFIIFNYRL